MMHRPCLTMTGQSHMAGCLRQGQRNKVMQVKEGANLVVPALGVHGNQAFNQPLPLVMQTEAGAHASVTITQQPGNRAPLSQLQRLKGALEQQL